MQKITPNLWFKRNAKEAVEYYLSIFPQGKVISTSYYPTEGLLDFQKEFAIKLGGAELASQSWLEKLEIVLFASTLRRGGRKNSVFL